ncbi:hypothetical protein M885DRAFT_511314 [Pelagophyceae sp. CCMP2097]|nr:hypothetical protein M885DRAFT_511314 [Pelagophyceae sp. CCMP2097]
MRASLASSLVGAALLVPTGGLEVIGAGLPRTGTSSLRVALEILYAKPVHGIEATLWSEVAQEKWVKLHFNRGNETLVKQAVEGFTASVGFPSAFFYEDLMEVYPEAKVILTVHPQGEDGWYHSHLNALLPLHWVAITTTWMGHLPPLKQWHNFCAFFYLSSDKVFLSHEAWYTGGVAQEKYFSWNREVRAAVKPEQFLEFRVDQGWGPLCSFLGKPIPAMPFPHVYDTDYVMWWSKRLIKSDQYLRCLCRRISGLGASNTTQHNTTQRG